jgi:hypothetical protein
MVLANKNAIIYGAGGAIGSALARTFAREPGPSSPVVSEQDSSRWPRRSAPPDLSTEQRATYVACAFEDSDDVAVLRGEPTWTFRELEAGHWPMVSVPDELVALLAEIASQRVRP